MLRFEKLDVYRKSLEYISKIYLVTQKFPKEEIYCLVDQLKRASISIATNIAEGTGRYHRKDYLQFLRVARSSGYECVALLQISLNQGYIQQNQYDVLYNDSAEITKMISGLVRAIETKKFSER